LGGSRVVVRVTPCSRTGLSPQVVRDLRVNVRGVVAVDGRVNLVRTELRNREANHGAGERRVRRGVNGVQRGRLSRSGSETISDSTSTRVTANRLGAGSENVLNDKVDGVNKVERHLVNETSGHVGEAEQIELVGDQYGVTVLVESNSHGGRVTCRNGVRVNKLIQRSDRLCEILVDLEDNRRSGHCLLSRSLVGDTAEHWLRT